MCGCLSCTSYWEPVPHPATQACALTGNPTGNLLVHRSALNPLSHTSQGFTRIFRYEFSLANILILALSDPKQRPVQPTQTSDLQKLCNNKWLLFNGTEVGNLIYSNGKLRQTYIGRCQVNSWIYKTGVQEKDLNYRYLFEYHWHKDNIQKPYHFNDHQRNE